MIWFGRLEIRELLHHLFRKQKSVGFLHVYQFVQNNIGPDSWAVITRATDSMLAFGLGWVNSIFSSRFNN